MGSMNGTVLDHNLLQFLITELHACRVKKTSHQEGYPKKIPSPVPAPRPCALAGHEDSDTAELSKILLFSFGDGSS